MTDTAISNAAQSRAAMYERIKATRAPRKMRALEFFLILFALAVGVAAIVIIDLVLIGYPSTTLLVPGIVFAVAVLGLHLAVRKFAPDADPLILPLVVFLNVIGIAMIYRLDMANHVFSQQALSVKQITWSVVAVVVAIIVISFLRNHLTLLRYTYVSGLAALILMVLPFVPGLGQEIGGERQWIHLFGYSFQPMELAKIALIIFFAGYLTRNSAALSMVGRKIGPLRLPRARDLGPLIMVWLLAMAVLILQHEFGISILIIGLFLAMLYLATGRTSWVMIGLSLFTLGGFIALKLVPRVALRFDNWIDPWRDIHGDSYQVVQGLFGMANGALIGTGWGLGYPQDTPVAESDYIIPSLGEELGLVGVFFILAAFLLLIERGLRVGFAGQDDFGKLLTTGLAFTLALQIFVVVGGVFRILPLTGLATPFLAAGGSSLLANWIIVALFLRASNSIRNQPKLVIRS